MSGKLLGKLVLMVDCFLTFEHTNKSLLASMQHFAHHRLCLCLCPSLYICLKKPVLHLRKSVLLVCCSILNNVCCVCACLLLNHSCCILAHGQLCLTRSSSTRRGQRTTSLWPSPQTEVCVVPSTPMSPELYGE